MQTLDVFIESPPNGLQSVMFPTLLQTARVPRSSGSYVTTLTRSARQQRSRASGQAGRKERYRGKQLPRLQSGGSGSGLRYCEAIMLSETVFFSAETCMNACTSSLQDLKSVSDPPSCQLKPKKTHIICTLGPSSRTVR